MTHRLFRALVSVALVLSCSTATGFSQSKEDRATLEKARSAYRVQPVPKSIACGVEIDWDRLFRDMKVEMNDSSKARLEKLKAIKTTFVSKGETETEVKVDAPDEFKSAADGVRQQLVGFFQMYWPIGYGNMLTVKPNDTFQLTRTPEGYKLGMASGETKVAMDMNQAYVITSMNVLSPQMKASMTTEFKPGEDGLLRLRSLDETIDLGESKMVVNVALDYQSVGAFDVPQHVLMALPGSFSFHYTFVGCDVKGPSSETPASKN